MQSSTVKRLALRNTLYLTVSQALTIPLAVVVNALLARYLGAAEFGYIYLAASLSGFGFLVVNWGHEGALPSLIALDRTRAGVLLGSSLVWRSWLGVVVYAVLAGGCYLLHYDAAFQWALALTFAITAITAFIAAFKDSIRGFERMDIPAFTHVGQQLLAAIVLVPVLLLGGGMRGALFSQIPVALVVLFLIWRTIRGVGMDGLSVRRDAMKTLFIDGTPFVFFNLAMALQPIIDAVFLSKLSPPEVMGWFAVSRRLLGVLLFPASALIGALYPTLVRLYDENRDSFAEISRGAFQGVALLSIPVALGCGLYPEVGVGMFSHKSFAPAEDNLRISALYLFLVYFSMPLGMCIFACGKRKVWSGVQGLCVVVSAVLDPLLVPWFQAHHHNGGLGLCIAGVISEALVIVCGLFLLPKGVIDKRLARSLLFALASGAVMALVARLLKGFSPFLGAPLAVLAYVIALWATGGVEKQQVAAVRAFVSRKFSRAP
ncbi:MAG: oligosaccharide flippase family protein [Polyangiaceae bacterium]